MIRHVVMFRWAAEATEEQKQQVAAELRRLPALLPVLRATTSDPTPAWPGGNFGFAVVADFDDLEGYQVYRDNPEHREITGKFIQPIAAQRRGPVRVLTRTRHRPFHYPAARLPQFVPLSPEGLAAPSSAKQRSGSRPGNGA
jgi:stress responsive alpha/beta barrel protein